jgi:hypothetical protein
MICDISSRDPKKTFKFRRYIMDKKDTNKDNEKKSGQPQKTHAPNKNPNQKSK